MTHESALQFAGQFWDHVSTSMYITLCMVVWVLRNGQRMLRKLPMPFEWKHFDARAARHDRWRIYFQSLHQSAECMHTVSVTPSSSFNPCKYFIVTVINTCPENGAVVGTAIIQFALHLTSAANQCNGQVILANLAEHTAVTWSPCQRGPSLSLGHTCKPQAIINQTNRASEQCAICKAIC